MNKCLIILLLIFNSCSLCKKTLIWENRLKLRTYFSSGPTWMQDQIFADFAGFDSNALNPLLFDQMMAMRDELKGGKYLIRYKIRNNQLKVQEYPQDPLVFKTIETRYRIMETSLKNLLKIVKIPNVDFVVCLGDSADAANLPAPVLAFAKNESLYESIILIPDFEALEGNKNVLKEVKKGVSTYPWQNKLNQAIWRGAMTGGCFNIENFLNFPRSQVVSTSLEQPALIDARFSAVTQCDDPNQVLKKFGHYFAPPLRVWEHLQFKYQLLIDGNSSSYNRAYWQLFSNCLMFKQNSPHIQWYYRALIPYMHYVPVCSNFHDLVKKIKWAQNHDKECEKISQNAQKFASQNLLKADIYFYLYLVLNEYAKKQNLNYIN